MTFSDAVKQSIRAYFNGIEPSELDKTSGKKRKYTKDYFDKIEKESVPKKDIKKPKKTEDSRVTKLQNLMDISPENS